MRVATRIVERMKLACGDTGEGGKTWKVRHTTSKAAWNSEGGETTVVLTGLPKTLKAEVLLALLDEHFPRAYDYFYLPMDMDKDKFENRGLAYINFRNHETAVQCQGHFDGSDDWKGHTSERPCKSEWSSIQGYAANIERQRRSAWITSTIPEGCKPMAFDEDGMRLPTSDIFPASLTDTGKDSRSWRTVSFDNGAEASNWWKDQWYGSSSSEQHVGKNRNSRGWYDSWSRKDDVWREHGSRSKWNNEGAWRDWTRWDDDGEGDAACSDARARNRIWRTSNWDPEDVVDEYGEASRDSANFEHGMTDEKKEEEECIPWKRREEEKENEAGNDDNLTLKVSILRYQPPLASLLGIPGNEPTELRTSAEALLSAKYACPHCGAVFMKWSACMHHIVTDSPTCQSHILPDGKLPADMTEFQEKCKAKSAEKSKPNADASIEQRGFQFQ